MQLNITTDYAIRIVLYSAITKSVVSASELSEKLMIPQSVVHKVGRKLGQHGVVQVSTGMRGGIRLILPPEDISIYDIVNIFEPTTKINRCLEEDKYCSRFATENCPVRKAYCHMQGQLEENLKSVTFADLLQEQ